MAHSIKRLTIYAWISALEIDLRELISLYIVPLLGSDTLFSVATENRVGSGLKKIILVTRPICRIY